MNAAAATTTAPPTAEAPSMTPSYLEQDCPLTLREGLEQFMASNAGLIASDESTEVGRLTKAHDCCHVLFGLTTEIGDEALADTWTLVGSDVTIRQYVAFLQHEEYKQLVADIATWSAFVEMIKATPRVLKAIVRGRRMSPKWPFFDYAAHLDTPLVELRRRYHIELVPRPN
ncbi:MAG: hypothetical protein KC486_28065 [Myxococcales bacterium]|nr:hypothetical protein [Myxococcales bacterium]